MAYAVKPIKPSLLNEVKKSGLYANNAVAESTDTIPSDFSFTKFAENFVFEKKSPLVSIFGATNSPKAVSETTSLK